uniref:Protein SHQ1 homolog n=1 Tax=Caenorhabditis japonica TaxID=281687 RepID=A0A8R1I8K9_CAEJA
MYCHFFYVITYDPLEKVFFFSADTLEPDEELTAIIAADFSTDLSITDADREKLKDLRTKRSHSIQSDSSIAISLVDIIFAYCYDQRVNGWETTCESGWSCAKLSPSLSYFSLFNSIRQALICSVHRAITYSLYRSFELAIKVVEDVKEVFRRGRSAILHIFCDIHRIFVESGDFRYILNDLFITDYILWIQAVPDAIIAEVQEKLAEIGEIKKSDLHWELEVLETEANLERIHLDSDDEPND